MKRLKSDEKQHSIFNYIVAYFCIVVLIITIMGGYLYRFLYNTVYSDFCINNTQHLAAIVSRHESDLQIIDNIVMQMVLEDDVTKFRLSTDPKKSNKLKDRLKGYTTVSQFFDLVFYQYHKDDYLYHYSSSVQMKFFLRNCVLDKTEQDKFAEMIISEEIGLRILPEQGVSGVWVARYLIPNTKHLILFRTIPTNYDDTLIFFVPGTYYDSLMGDDAGGSYCDFMYYQGEILLTRGSVALDEEQLYAFLRESEKAKELWKDSDQKKVQIENKNYLLSYEVGESGICYGTLQPVEVFHEKVRTERWVVWMLILLCVFLASTVIMLISLGVVRKVKGLNLLLNRESVYDLSGIESGIQALVNTHNESEKESLRLKKVSLIRDFVRGDFPDRVSAVERAKKAGLQMNYSKYVIMLLRSREMSKENQAYTRMLQAIADTEGVDGYGIHLINNNQNLFVLFSDETEKIEKTFEVLLEIERFYCKEYVIAVSDIHENFSESSQAYLEADTAFDNHLLMDNSRLIRFTDVVQQDYVNLVPDNYLQRLKSAIRSCDVNAVEIAVRDICNKINGENASLYTFRIFYNDIIHILLSEWKGDKEKLNSFYNVFTLSQCLNIQDFYDLLCDICKDLINRHTGRELSNSHIVQNAIAYMQANYSDPDLTMNKLAEQLQISSVALSVEFKNEMEISPLNYLANLRIEKAKLLLQSTDMLIKDVSLAVGYEDDFVFRRWFKKYTGMTPGQYRGR